MQRMEGSTGVFLHACWAGGAVPQCVGWAGGIAPQQLHRQQA
jgi:hypothetical protein